METRRPFRKQLRPLLGIIRRPPLSTRWMSRPLQNKNITPLEGLLIVQDNLDMLAAMYVFV